MFCRKFAEMFGGIGGVYSEFSERSEFSEYSENSEMSAWVEGLHKRKKTAPRHRNKQTSIENSAADIKLTAKALGGAKKRNKRQFL